MMLFFCHESWFVIRLELEIFLVMLHGRVELRTLRGVVYRVE